MVGVGVEFFRGEVEQERGKGKDAGKGERGQFRSVVPLNCFKIGRVRRSELADTIGISLVEIRTVIEAFSIKNNVRVNTHKALVAGIGCRGAHLAVGHFRAARAVASHGDRQIRVECAVEHALPVVDVGEI